MNDFFYGKKQSRFGAIEIIIFINIILFIPCLFSIIPILNYPYYWSKSFFSLNIGIRNVPCFERGAFWQVLTAMFMHGSISHIFFNLYALYIFGKPLEVKWGSKKFVLFYLTVGILANLVGALPFIFAQRPLSLIGASGAVYGVLLAFGSMYPNVRLLLFFLIPIKVKWCVLLYAIIEIISELFGTPDGVAHSVHLLGFLFAFLYMLIFMRKNAIKEMFFNDDNYY